MKATRRALKQPPFLPTSRAEIDDLGWDGFDALIISGDAYVDHLAFGPALLGRLLVSRGFRTALLCQPDWTDAQSFLALGRPRLFAGITAGSLDSMLAHYTAFRKKRHDDAYTPGGRAGARPNRACLVYSGLARTAFPGLPVVLGGIEASLRRASHYDFWKDSLRRSILLDSKADLLLYGMAEKAILELADRLERAAGAPPEPKTLRGIPGSARVPAAGEEPPDAPLVELPGHEEILAEPAKLMTATLLMEEHIHQGGHYLRQKSGGREVLFSPPAPLLSAAEMDEIYALPFRRATPPSTGQAVPAAEMLKSSLTAHRGCGGGCAFCSLALHQGRRISSRSADSLAAEAGRLAAAGHTSISDVGGPSANMWGALCLNQGECRRKSCLTPSICRYFKDDQGAFLKMLRRLAKIPGLRQVRVASGLRPDLALRDPQNSAAIMAEFIGGQAKIAPEHISARVLALMRKPPFAVFEDFLKLFDLACRRAGKKQFIVPYLISAHPGCEKRDMLELKDWLKKKNWSPRQVQCFIPLPGTISAAMFYAGIDERGRPLPVARQDAERLAQHGLLAARAKRRPDG